MIALSSWLLAAGYFKNIVIPSAGFGREESAVSCLRGKCRSLALLGNKNNTLDLLTFFRTLVERRWYDLRFHALAAYLYFHSRSYIRKLRRYIRQRDILFQKWRVRSAGHVADFAAAFILNFVAIA